MESDTFEIVGRAVELYTFGMFKKILSFYTKYFAVWVVLFGVTAYFLPGPFVALKGYMDWFFALTMFGIGAVLQAEDFKQIAQRPLIVLVGSAA